MMKILCAPNEQLASLRSGQHRSFSLFKGSEHSDIGVIARDWKATLIRQEFAPSIQAWDFVQFCLSVCAADLACKRDLSADGWTRNIELTIALNQPERWHPWKQHSESLLRVLTGDYWTIHFIDGGESPPSAASAPLANDSVSLLSGGLDSFIGAIDAVAEGRKPLFVSQLAHEDSARQRNYASLLGESNHFQWSHAINFKGGRESSTRARSLAFYGFAVLAATKVQSDQVTIFVPENGFISVNPPLLPGRVSSLSTRTTHPLFISMLQQLLHGLGISVSLELPYKFKTKGQMLQECKDQKLLADWASDTTSCGRFRVYNRTHCGRCVPCMIRRSAFLEWGQNRDSTRYKFPNLVRSGKASGPDDPMAVALAVLQVRREGLDRFLGASLAFAPIAERAAYRQVLHSGIKELEVLLQADGLL